MSGSRNSGTWTIGLVGGVASGKSLVAQMLANHGAHVLDADRAAHEVLQEPDIQQQLVERWGNTILDSHGQINRQAIADRVFGNEDQAIAERHFLEQLVHPRAQKRLEQERQEQARQGVQVFVMDVPLLLEAGWQSTCDAILMVDTPPERRQQWAGQRGWERAELARREAVQMPLTEKRRRATNILSNRGDKLDLQQQVDRFWGSVVLPHLFPSP